MKSEPAPQAMEITNACGKSVYRAEFTSTPSVPTACYVLDVSGLNNGVYFLRVTCSEKTFVKKIIKT